MIGDAAVVVLLVGGYGAIAVLGARAVLRDELARWRSRTSVPGAQGRLLSAVAQRVGSPRRH